MHGTYIVVDGVRILVTVKRRSRQKNIRLLSRDNGSLVVSAPHTCTKEFIDDVVARNVMWIKKNIITKRRLITVDPAVVAHMKKIARPMVEAKLLQFNAYYGYKYKRVQIRYQNSRWGSCSTNGTLSFNCAIMCLPHALREYIVVHEICHIARMDHSPAFWALVEETIPDYKKLRRELKSYNLS